MTEWTSLGVTEAQKDRIEAQKPDGEVMGKFLVQAVEEGTSTGEDLEMEMPQLATTDQVENLEREIKKAQEIAEQARDEAHAIKEGMGR